MKKTLLMIAIPIVAIISCKKDNPKPPVPPIHHVTQITTLGANYQGGIVFYIDNTGQHGMVCAPTDQSAGIKWYDHTNSQIFTDASMHYDLIGNGAYNTSFITGHYGPGVYAAYLCDTLTLNGYSDWFLPSKLELNEIYQGAYLNANLGAYSYSSSTEYDALSIWSMGSAHSMSGGGNNKGTLMHVRAVRAF